MDILALLWTFGLFIRYVYFSRY